MKGSEYRIFGTTADLGVAARGKGLGEVCAQAARGMFSVLIDLRSVRPLQAYPVTARGDDAASMLVAFLNELIFLHATQGLVMRRFEVKVGAGFNLEATAWGEEIDLERHCIETDIKAATYHRVSVEQRNGLWRARVILDV